MRMVYMMFMSLSVFILSSVLLVKQNTSIIFGDASDLYTVNISVEKAQTPAQIENILKQLREIHPQDVKKVTLISPQELITGVESVLPTYSSGLIENEELEQILNPVVEVQLSPEAKSEEIIRKMRLIPGISDVNFSGDWIEKFKNLFSVANLILDTLFVLFFVILSFLIAILIRNYLISAKDSIALQTLLGATPQQAFIKPYTQIMLSTLISYAVGIVFTLALSVIIQQKFSSNVDFAFINTRLSFLNNINIFIIAIGLSLNLLISYGLSYQYIKREYYKHE